MFKQLAQNYFMHAAEAGNANAMAFLGKVTFISFIPLCFLLSSLPLACCLMNKTYYVVIQISNYCYFDCLFNCLAF